jgi:hypothetical protein
MPRIDLDALLGPADAGFRYEIVQLFIDDERSADPKDYPGQQAQRPVGMYLYARLRARLDAPLAPKGMKGQRRPGEHGEGMTWNMPWPVMVAVRPTVEDLERWARRRTVRLDIHGLHLGSPNRSGGTGSRIRTAFTPHLIELAQIFEDKIEAYTDDMDPNRLALYVDVSRITHPHEGKWTIPGYKRVAVVDMTKAMYRAARDGKEIQIKLDWLVKEGEHLYVFHPRAGDPFPDELGVADNKNRKDTLFYGRRYASRATKDDPPDEVLEVAVAHIKALALQLAQANPNWRPPPQVKAQDIPF